MPPAAPPAAVVLLPGQDPDHRPPPPAPGSRVPVAARVAAVPAARPPGIDGRDDDEVWRQGPGITPVPRRPPREGREPRVRPEGKDGFGTRHFFVVWRAFGPP